MSKVRLCFLGTPDFAVTCLKGLLADSHYEVVGVITQPDRPSGRKLQLTPSPVKALCLEKGLRVITPESVNKEPMLEEIQKWGAEVAVVVAFGQILSTKFLNLFPFGAVNVHGSLLPRWRGAAPIQRAIEHGDTETGVALQKMVKELDAGDVLGVRTVEIKPDTNATELYEQLAVLGADLLRVELMDYIRGNLAPTPQDPSGVTYAKKIEKSEAEIDWSLPAVKIHNKVRAFTMGPGTFTTFSGKKIKIHKTKVISEAAHTQADPGSVIHVTDKELVVATGEGGALSVLELQPESRNRLSVVDFLKSSQIKKGDQFAHS